MFKKLSELPFNASFTYLVLTMVVLVSVLSLAAMGYTINILEYITLPKKKSNPKLDLRLRFM